MALPKYKTSRANTHSRRANWKAKAAQTVTCPNCGAPSLPHMPARAAAPTAAACTARLSAPSTPSEWLPSNGMKH